MSMDFEWYSGPHGRFHSKLIHLINRVHCGLRCLSHQQRQRRQQLWQTLHTQRKQLTIQGSKLRQPKWSDIWDFFSRLMISSYLSRFFLKFDVKSAPCSGVFVASLCDSCAALCEHS